MLTHRLRGLTSPPHASSRAARGLLVSSTTLVSLPRAPRAAREGLLSVSRLLNEQTEHPTERSFQRSLALVLCMFRFGLWAAGQLTGHPAEAQSRCDSPLLSLLTRGCVVATLEESCSFCLWLFLCFLQCHLVPVHRCMDASSGTSKHHYVVLRHCVIVGSRWMLPCSTVGQFTTTCSTDSEDCKLCSLSVCSVLPLDMASIFALSLSERGCQAPRAHAASSSISMSFTPSSHKEYASVPAPVLRKTACDNHRWSLICGHRSGYGRLLPLCLSVTPCSCRQQHALPSPS